MRFHVDGAIAIVTGASSGIGWHLCRLLIQRGATVIAVARRQQRLLELQEQLNVGGRSEPLPDQRFHFVVGDVTDPAVCQQAIQLADRLGGGRLDLIVNNAGIGAIGPFEQASEQRLRRIMEVNFFAPCHWTRAALPLLHHGRNAVICNVSSVLGHRAVPDKSEYCASKFALHGWSDSLRAELAASGIQVTLVSPSTTASEFFDSVIDTPPGTTSHSLGSWPPERVAKAALAAIIARRSETILSLGGKSLVYADRLAPALMNRLLAKK
jgi:short-subunit dehydrogenase